MFIAKINYYFSVKAAAILDCLGCSCCADVTKRRRLLRLLLSHANPLKPNFFKLLHFALQPKPTVFNFRHSGTLALSPERQSARMSKIKNLR